MKGVCRCYSCAAGNECVVGGDIEWRVQSYNASGSAIANSGGDVECKISTATDNSKCTMVVISDARCVPSYYW